MDDAIAFDARGLVGCVVQDWASGEVLTLAYMNREALERTRATGELHLWSRSRGELCHKGERTCFHRGELGAQAPHEALPALERTIAARAAERPEGSYTAQLLADPPHIGAKVREEADEVARAAEGESDQRLGEEAADVLYHLTVLLAARGLTLADALQELNGRRR